MINEEYSQALIEMAYSEAERRILRAALDISEGRNKGFKFFQELNIRGLVDQCHEEMMREHMGDD